MSGIDIVQKYGRKKMSQAVNAAIRAEIPGGNEVVELGTKYSARLLATQINPNEPTPPASEVYAEIYADLRRLRDVMGDEIARRYGLRTKLTEENANVLQ